MEDKLFIKFFVITFKSELRESLIRYLKYVMNIRTLGEGSFDIYPQKMFEFDAFIIEVFNFENYLNPVGWQMGKKLASLDKKVLLVFKIKHDKIPQEGSFWITLLSEKPLSEKIREVIDSPTPTIKDFEKLEDMWSQLKYKPEDHHHG